MPVRLGYEAGSEAQAGRNRLRKLASFGRYGADLHESAAMYCSSKPVVRSTPGRLAASFLEFYGWLAKQAGHRVSFGSTSHVREPKLALKHQVRPC